MPVGRAVRHADQRSRHSYSRTRSRRNCGERARRDLVAEAHPERGGRCARPRDPPRADHGGGARARGSADRADHSGDTAAANRWRYAAQEGVVVTGFGFPVVRPARRACAARSPKAHTRDDPTRPWRLQASRRKLGWSDRRQETGRQETGARSWCRSLSPVPFRPVSCLLLVVTIGGRLSTHGTNRLAQRRPQRLRLPYMRLVCRSMDA